MKHETWETLQHCNCGTLSRSTWGSECARTSSCALSLSRRSSVQTLTRASSPHDTSRMGSVVHQATSVTSPWCPCSVKGAASGLATCTQNKQVMIQGREGPMHDHVGIPRQR